MEPKRIVVDLNKFKCVKILIESKAPYAEIEEMTGCSTATIARIKAARDFDEYKQNARSAAIAYSAKVKQRVEEQAKKEEERLIAEQIKEKANEAVLTNRIAEQKPQVTNQMASNYQMNRLIEIIKEQNEILKIMSNKIAFIVDELTK